MNLEVGSLRRKEEGREKKAVVVRSVLLLPFPNRFEVEAGRRGRPLAHGSFRFVQAADHSEKGGGGGGGVSRSVGRSDEAGSVVLLGSKEEGKRKGNHCLRD